MNDYSLITYNIFTDECKECAYFSSEYGVSHNLMRFSASFRNGDIVCKIEGDWRDMKYDEICEKCCKIIKKTLKY